MVDQMYEIVGANLGSQFGCVRDRILETGETLLQLSVALSEQTCRSDSGQNILERARKSVCLGVETSRQRT